MSVSDDRLMGFIIEVDVDYTYELHDSYRDYPLCCEATPVQLEELSPYTRFLAEKLKISPTGCHKLIGNLKHKKMYAVHYRNLKLYVSLGL